MTRPGPAHTFRQRMLSALRGASMHMLLSRVSGSNVVCIAPLNNNMLPALWNQCCGNRFSYVGHAGEGRSFSTIQSNSEVAATDSSLTLSETMRRILSLENASQEEKNRFRLRQTLKDYQLHSTDTGKLRSFHSIKILVHLKNSRP